MTYAFILLAFVAVLTMSVWSGISAPEVDGSGIRASIRSAYEDLRDKATGAVKNKVRQELHEVVDDKLE